MRGYAVYKLLLCWRYLLTRYLALACIISVMLGVATLIVVNSVMGGFSTKLKERLHGLLSDVLIESTSIEGFADADGKMKRIMASPIGHQIEAMTPTVEVFAIMQFSFWNGHQEEKITRPVRVIGIDPEGRTRVGGFAEHLVLQRDSKVPSFALSADAMVRYQLRYPPAPPVRPEPIGPDDPPQPDPPPSSSKVPRGIIVGQAIASFRDKNVEPGQPPKDIYLLRPGDAVKIMTVSAQKMQPVYDHFVVCDYFKSEMSEYDANYVFVPLDYLQHLRTMENRVTSIQIRMKDYAANKVVVKETLEKLFPGSRYQVQTWEDKQGPLLSAIAVEKGILNVLLFMIIAVAGFGILAIFAMIVVEKTRDIGILKALGASNGGIMAIFLGYGTLLGVVGSGLGTWLGVTITVYLNEIEKFLAQATGQEIFPKTVYYFDKIPTDIQPFSILMINLGAIGIAVFFSVVPALRAAMLHPVRALRYE